MNILAYHSPTNARVYRLDNPGKYIERQSANLFAVTENPMSVEEMSMADVVVLQQTISQDKISFARQYTRENVKLMVAELDDNFDTNPDNPFTKEHIELKAEYWLEVLCGVADIITTTTPYLAKEIERRLAEHEVVKPIVVLPNCLDMEKWDLPRLRNYSDEIRLVWAGSSTHRDDMEFISPVIHRLCKKYPQLKFIYAGDVKLKPLFADINSEYIDGVPVEVWPAKLHSLRADLAVAPLIDTTFNRCKSNLKYLEYGICGLPAVYSSVMYSETIREGGLIATTQDEFYDKLSLLIENRQLREEIGQKAYLDVRNNYSAKDHAKDWLDTYWYYYSQLNPLKLDLAGGKRPVKGYVNVDADPTSANIVADIIEGLPLADGSVEEIHASAIIEHFYVPDLIEKVLPEILRILKKGGRFYCAQPDFQKVIKSDNWHDIQQNLYGAKHNIPVEHDIHKQCWDSVHLIEVLKDAGFKKIKEIPYTEPYHDPNYTFALEAYK